LNQALAPFVLPCLVSLDFFMNATLAQLKDRFEQALVAAFGSDLAGTDPILVPASNPKFGDYQSNVAMSLTKRLGQPPRAIADQLIAQLKLEDLCDPPTVAGPGFINLTLKPDYLANQLRQIQIDSRLGVPQAKPAQRTIVDFSSPNIAKEMHVGHLRSTIIGDSIARVLEFWGHDVQRINHLGDWGTQFGMLILHLKEAYPEALTTANALALGDLTTFYKQAKQRFDEDEDFRERARLEVVELQAGNSDTLSAWKLLCEQSFLAFQEIYDLLDIKITNRGESFYNPLLAAVVEDLNQAGLLVEDQGAQCVFLEGFTNKEGKPLPLIIKKSDGGYNYATTDLAAVRYRIRQEQVERIIYVTDAGQANHFAQVWQVARRAGWIPVEVELVHVPFGLVQGEDGKKFKTRSGDTVRLRDLLDEAVARARADLESRLQTEGRQESEEFIAHAAQVIGISAVKYADLSQNRTSNYIFSYDKMLSLQGNTAPYLLYAYVRVQGISRKGGIDFQQLGADLPIVLSDETELTLAKHLLSFDETLSAVEAELMPNRLCQYLFELSQKFNQFYDRCPILQAEEPQRTTRLVLADLTARTIQLGLSLLGIPVLERM
jgi:arginyl-tRNA synthetase